jgi:hypothetical protein
VLGASRPSPAGAAQKPLRSLDPPARDADRKGQTSTTGENIMETENQNLPWEIEKIIEVAISLKTTGSTGASTGERIAAAFVLNRPDYLPALYDDMLEAWDRLDDQWQAYVRHIKQHCMHRIEAD